MAKVQIKSEKLTPFGGIFSIMEKFDSMLSPVIDSTLGQRCRRKLAAEILSEKDPAAAWTDWVMNENRPKVKVTEEAKNTVEDNMELLEKLGIETVPAIYLADGEGPYGFMTAMELISKIEQEGGKEDEGKEPKEL